MLWVAVLAVVLVALCVVFAGRGERAGAAAEGSARARRGRVELPTEIVIWYLDDSGRRRTSLLTIRDFAQSAGRPGRYLIGYCNYRRAPLILPYGRIVRVMTPDTGESFTDPVEALAKLASRLAPASPRPTPFRTTARSR